MSIRRNPNPGSAAANSQEMSLLPTTSATLIDRRAHIAMFMSPASAISTRGPIRLWPLSVTRIFPIEWPNTAPESTSAFRHASWRLILVAVITPFCWWSHRVIITKTSSHHALTETRIPLCRDGTIIITGVPVWTIVITEPSTIVHSSIRVVLSASGVIARTSVIRPVVETNPSGWRWPKWSVLSTHMCRYRWPLCWEMLKLVFYQFKLNCNWALYSRPLGRTFRPLWLHQLIPSNYSVESELHDF